ncbi:hypothetical protein CASFOL_002502 [Castilleja foliolosa]|uniref:Thioredoxin domain-containing protein n=1 Tax=Castilleja foliolosa TaxID=1961234 RepID=A0ABD3EES4_9LAMI
MSIAFTSTSTPFHPVRTVTAPVNTKPSAFPPCSPCSTSAFSNPNKVWFRNQRKSPPLFSTHIKCAAGGGVVSEIDETQFSDVVLKSERPVLVEFVATWCGPCRLIAPAVQSLAQEYQDKLVVVKIDHDANPRLIEEYKVYGLPALIVFRNGQEVAGSRREGAITKAKLKEYVDKILESASIA